MKLFQKLIKVLKNIGINANKIKLSANDILNLLAGNEINLGSKKITIKSDNFSVNENGIMKCVNAILNGVKIVGSYSENDVPVEITSEKDGEYYKTKIAPGEISLKWEKQEMYLFPNNLYMKYYSAGAGAEVLQCLQKYGYYVECNGTSTSVDYDGITTPTLTQTSLAEQKKNFEKMQDGAIDVLKNIDIYKYNLKCEKDTDKKHIGFVIGDKYNYSKEVTSLDNKGVDNYSFTSLCCKAIQELSQQVESLQDEIKELKEDKQ